jgi:uncharacterized surface protein with fasciclin (FAS1) repeats
MKHLMTLILEAVLAGIFSCNQGTGVKVAPQNTNDSTSAAGAQEKVNDDQSQKDIVKIAASSKDHTTLVAALKQADLITSLSNAGPFTVFAPTNAAFDKLPAGTVDGLMKAEKKEDLQNILQYHVALGGLKKADFKDGQILGMVNGDNVPLQVKDGKVTLNNSAQIVATIPAANGIIYVIDAVLLPPAAKK